MKTLLTLIIASVLSLSCLGQSTNFNYNQGATYYWIMPHDPALQQSILQSDRLAINGLKSTVQPKIEFESLPGHEPGFIWWAGDRFLISSNITVWGTISASTNLIWATNVVFATNSSYATNDQWGNVIAGTNAIYADTNLYKLTQSYYPTNTDTEDVMMTIPYADVVFAPNFFWNYVVGRSTTNYQTAVRFLRASPARVGGTNFTFPNNVKAVGTPWITNLTVCTWIYNPAVPETNLLVLPIW